LFVVKGDEIVLIDYKYSNSTSDDYLVDKYKNQLKLYKNSLKNAFSKQINDVYLLSLKHSKLIKVDI
jgi:ATP-dependent helicase/nuclease subunit A